MRVFVAGATGAIGRSLVPQLVSAGRQVTAMTRSEEKVRALREAGAEAVVCDVFDADALTRAMAEAGLEALIHELTDIPKGIAPRRIASQFAGTNRLRIEGTRNLIRAASAAGVSRVLAQSVAFAYAPVGGPVKSEADPLFLDPHPGYRSLIQAVIDLERQVTEARGVVLRYGYFYGPGTAYALDGQIGGLARKRRFPIVGGGTGVSSFIHVEDAASATVAALERGRPGPYNVVDDEPAPAREWLPVYSGAVGGPRPMRAPRWLARLVAGEYGLYLATQQRGASNEKAKRELEWKPKFASWRTGFRQSLG